MLVNADFSLPVVVTPGEHRWVASPQAGVERVMLDRIGEETARATSLVRYAPDSHFPPHLHAGGEEILVLSGVFSDEGGDYPAGWYLRNPRGSRHQPASAPGAVIFVKLRQMRPGEHAPVRIDSNDAKRWTMHAGRAVCELFQGEAEHVVLQRLDPGQPLFDDGELVGAEILVLHGALARDAVAWPAGTWIRQPAGRAPEILAGPQGATVYLKTGCLGDPLTMETP